MDTPSETGSETATGNASDTASDTVHLTVFVTVSDTQAATLIPTVVLTPPDTRPRPATVARRFDSGWSLATLPDVTLSDLGWSDFFTGQFAQHQAHGLVPARGVCQEKHLYLVHDATAELAAELSGRFRDCRHDEEPGCAVRAALESGELTPERLRNFEKMQRELRFLARRQRWAKMKKHDPRPGTPDTAADE